MLIRSIIPKGFRFLSAYYVYNNLECVRLLLTYGADIHVPVETGMTAMSIALQHLDRRGPQYLAVLPDVVSLLLDKGLNVNDFICRRKETALNMAVRYSHELLVKFLLERGG